MRVCNAASLGLRVITSYSIHYTKLYEILRLWKRADGEHAEKLVFEKIGAAKPLRDVRIVPVDTAQPFCREEADYLAPASLALIARVFRKYLDETSYNFV